MGRTYYVPRSVKGESRILYIFTIKSFIYTAAFGLVGGGIWYLSDMLFNAGIGFGFLVTVFLGLFGWAISTIKIPDIPMMGKFRRAGGEALIDIIQRFVTFRKRKKIYVYNIKRGGE